MFFNLPNAINVFLATFLSPPVPDRSLTFHLRHQHAVSNDSRTLFSNVSPHLNLLEPSLYTGILTHPISVSKRNSLAWDTTTIPGPDTTSRETLLLLAKMTYNAYTSPDASDWYPLPSFNQTTPFGWEPSSDGFRGHVFVSSDNSTVVISVKGTSAGWIVGGGGPTVVKDKLNDNLLFSCCCARVGPTWSPVCGCYQGGGKCGLGCVQEALAEDSLFYSVGIVSFSVAFTVNYTNSNVEFV